LPAPIIRVIPEIRVEVLAVEVPILIRDDPRRSALICGNFFAFGVAALTRDCGDY